jgi:hypothetical protein
VFFPSSNGDGDRSGNCRPGTVIDSDVVSPVETDYYLYGHAGLLGTSKPAHYNVLHDENNFTCVVSCFLIQPLSNNVEECFTLWLFCNRSGMAFTDLTASKHSHLPFVMCMLGAPVLSRCQLLFTVSSHSPHSSPIYLCSNKSRRTQRVHPCKKPLRPATGPPSIFF